MFLTVDRVSLYFDLSMNISSIQVHAKFQKKTYICEVNEITIHILESNGTNCIRIIIFVVEFSSRSMEE